tara:strand:+ start:83 stop:316 length:234 start_codon:yes stop_codon:yes gene_type:complete
MSPNNEGVYNNADSFAMAFDEEWTKLSTQQNKSNSDSEKKLELVLDLDSIKYHPFFKNNPEKAKEVALFRIRLLSLN